MAETPLTERPSFTFDDPTLLRLALLRESIDNDPLTYQLALGRIASGIETPPPTTAKGKKVKHDPVEAAGQNLAVFFSERDDMHITYDAATETAVEGNEVINSLIADLHNYTSIRRPAKGRTGTSTVKAHPKAAETRDQIRYLTLGTYINRVVEWNQSQPTKNQPKKLRSAS